MITALHGSVGSSIDWNSLTLPHVTINGINLWKYLDQESVSLQETGKLINQQASAGSSILMGYSLGGRIALHSLLEKKSTWKKAIIISSHTGLATEKERNERKTHDQQWSEKINNLPWEVFLKEWNQQAILPDCDLPDRVHLKQYKSQIAQSFIDWSTGQQNDLLNKLSNVKIPVLWVTGEEDGKFSKIGSQASKKMPNCQHVVIPDCGHRVPWEQPNSFQKVVCDFLKHS